MITNPHTGLTEKESNVALAEWLAQRNPNMPIWKLSPCLVNAAQFFTVSLNSMALITDAMTPEELKDFCGEVFKLVLQTRFEAPTDAELIQASRAATVADASTRATAAIIALNLGKGDGK